MVKVVVIFVGSFLLQLPSLSAQDVNLLADKDPFLAHSLIDNLRSSSIGFGAKNESDENVLFEGRIIPYIVSPNIPWPTFLPRTLVFSPEIDIRMLNSRSNPIRTPSYRPSLTMYWYSQKVQRGCYECFHQTENADCISSLADVLKSAFLSVKIEHHSNGQSGDFLLPDGTINFREGNFSTNFVEPSLHFLTSLHSQSRLYLQWHPDINRELGIEDHFGFFRVGGEYVWGSDTGDSLLRARAEVILDEYKNLDGTKRPAIDRWTFNVRYEHDLFGWTDLGWFADLHLGPDYYNLRFANNLRSVQFGLFARLYRISSKIQDL